MFGNVRKTLIISIILGLTNLLTASCGQTETVSINKNAPTVSSNSEPKAESQTVQISIEKYAFSPAQITVSAGTKIIWTNKDSVAHTVTSDEKKFDSGLFGQNKEFSHVFDTPGTFAYHCTPHPNMKAEIIVK